MKDNSPLCSVIVLNYFGEKIIENTVNSLLSMNYPKNKFEIVVVDNGSRDKSREILTASYSNHENIKLVFLKKNVGFSKGNNIGIKNSKGRYVALINNDCIPDSDFLKELIKCAEKDPKTFAVNSKILRYPRFINLNFTTHPILTPVYTWLSKSTLNKVSEDEQIYLPLWRENKRFRTELSYDPFMDKTVEFCILFNSKGLKIKKNIDFKKLVSFDNKSVHIDKVTRSGDDIEYQLSIKVLNSGIVKNSLDKVQNAGILVFQDGYGRDVGAIIRSNQQFFEYDLGQYNLEKEVYAACAAAVLYNRKIMDEIGLLNESFFMYYEDVEISERARLLGYKIVYAPLAKVRHYHALSSKEWSPFFIYHVEKGRLLHVFYSYPIRVFFYEYFLMIFQSSVILLSIPFRLRTFFYNVKTKQDEDKEPKFARRIQIIKALMYFFVNFPMLLLYKFKLNRLRKNSVVEINYQQILKGEWYFK